jgi:hypothetical protein
MIMHYIEIPRVSSSAAIRAWLAVLRSASRVAGRARARVRRHAVSRGAAESVLTWLTIMDLRRPQSCDLCVLGLW